MKKIKSVIIIIFIMSIFMIQLNTYSFKEKVNEVTASSDNVILLGAKNRIEYSLKNGKGKLDFLGIDKLINNLLKSIKSGKGIILVDNKDNLIYSTLTDEQVSQYGNKLYKLKHSENEYDYNIVGKEFISKVDICDGDYQTAKLYCISDNTNDQKIIRQYLFKVSMIMILGAILFSINILLYLKLASKTTKKTESIELTKSSSKKFIKQLSNKSIVIFLLVFQIVTTFISFYIYENMINQKIEYTVDNTTSAISQNINKIIENNIDTDDLSNFDDYVNKIKSTMNSLEDYKVNKSYENGKLKYTFSYTISKSYMNSVYKQNLINSLTILIITVFFFLEVNNVSYTLTEKDKAKSVISGIRAQSFFLFVSYYVSIFFVPIQMMNIIKASNITSNIGMLQGIPTSTEAFLIAIVSIISGKIIDKRGLNKVYKLGNIVLVIGFLLSFMSHDIYVFIVSRAVCGVGYGLSLICIRTYAASCEDNQISEAIAGINASAYASLNIGSIVGGYIGEFFDIKYAFLVSSILCIVGLLFFYLKPIAIKIRKSEKIPFITTIKGFIKDKSLIFSVVLVLLPISISVAFLDYFYPVYASNNLMIKLTDVSKGYLLNGLIIVLLGVFINKYLNKLLSVRGRFILASILLGSALIIFSLMLDILGIYIAIVIISLAMSFASGTYIEYYMTFDAVKKIGLAESMSVYTLFDKLGAYLAPITYGFILTGNTKIRLIILGVYTVLSINVFNLLLRRRRTAHE